MERRGEKMPQSNEYMLKQDDAELIYQKKLTAGTNITIDPITNTISATGGGGGGSTVSVIPIVTTGTKIATIVVDAIERDLYAPGADVRVTPTVSTGVQIATITIDGTDYYLYAPEGSGGSQVYFGTTDPSDAIGNDKDFYYKLTNLRNTYPVYTHLKMVINANRDDDNYTQLSKINIIDTNSNIFDWSGTTVSCSAETGAGDGPENLIDGLTSTKACAETTPTAASPIEFTFTLGTPIDTEDYQSWCWYTADADSERDPISFDFYGSEDGEVWELLTSVTAQEITTTREALAYTEDFALSVGEISILNRYVKIDDTWIVESGGSGNVADVYVNGTSVLDENDIAQVFSHEEITEISYDNLPSTKFSDNHMYLIKEAGTPPTGEYYNPVIYSTEEREIGVWVDDKPLYQKSVTCGSIMNRSSISLGIENVEHISLVPEGSWVNDGERPLPYVIGSDASNNIGGYFTIGTSDTSFEVRMGNGSASDSRNGVITVQYTKTTDVAGSGRYNTLGVPAVHYTTDEQVVGTWFGETLYEKTFDCGGLLNAQTKEISFNENMGILIIVDAFAMSTTEGYVIPIPDVVPNYVAGSLRLYINKTTKKICIYTQTDMRTYDKSYVTLRYTKTTD